MLATKFLESVKQLPVIISATRNLLGEIELQFMLSNFPHRVIVGIASNTYKCETYIPLQLEDYLQLCGFQREVNQLAFALVKDNAQG